MTTLPKMIFVNIPVTDLSRAIAFYEAVGAVRDDRFADDSAQAMSFSDSIHIMLLTHEKFQSFTTRPLVAPRDGAQVLISLSAESRDAVLATVKNAIAAGGAEHHPAEDHGFMLSCAFEDPDGNAWGIMYMDLDAFMAMRAETAA